MSVDPSDGPDCFVQNIQIASSVQARLTILRPRFLVLLFFVIIFVFCGSWWPIAISGR